MIHRRSLNILIGILVCVFLVWAADWASHRRALKRIRELAPDALCVVELEKGIASASGTFTTSQTIEQFRVRVCPEANRERLTLCFDVGNFTGTFTRFQEFGVGRMIPPGTYEVTLRQVKGEHGGIVVILDKATASAAPTGTTRWQIISRAYLGLLVICGIWAFANRKSSNQRRRASSALAFQYVFAGFFVMFVYLLCHEGGHALGEISFGRYDFAKSDFWGIRGRPHSGGIAGPALEPWQQNLITGGAVIVPVLVAWVLFVLWWLWLRGRRNQLVRFYCCVTAGVLNLQYVIVGGGALFGIINSGHFDAFVACMPGPQRFAKALPWICLLVCIFMLWRIVPEITRILKAQLPGILKTDQSQESNESNHPQKCRPTAPTDG